MIKINTGTRVTRIVMIYDDEGRSSNPVCKMRRICDAVKLISGKWESCYTN
jgi:hypothetical protein